MASLLPRPPPTFSTFAGLGFTTPPAPPPSKKSFGSYCFRATCRVEDAQGCPVAKVKGYGKSPEVSTQTEQACRRYVDKTGLGDRWVCGDAEVVLLPSLNMECEGEIFFVMDGSVKKLV